MPYITQVAIGRRDHPERLRQRLRCYPDGTEVRDYIHVVDLAMWPCGCRSNTV